MRAGQPRLHKASIVLETRVTFILPRPSPSVMRGPAGLQLCCTRCSRWSGRLCRRAKASRDCWCWRRRGLRWLWLIPQLRRRLLKVAFDRVLLRQHGRSRRRRRRRRQTGASNDGCGSTTEGEPKSCRRGGGGGGAWRGSGGQPETEAPSCWSGRCRWCCRWFQPETKAPGGRSRCWGRCGRTQAKSEPAPCCWSRRGRSPEV